MLAVLVFHLNKGWLPGGFTGVDIFYVISGYVVMGSLLSHGSQALAPRLGNFYLRRVRRLMPNLLVCLAVTSLGVALLIPPLESGPYFIVALKALFGWSNNYLMGQTDYFAQDSDLNPFLHTWSLGVEQQFYLVFPLLMVGIGYGVRRSVPLLAALTVLSLAACWWWTQTAPMAAFFLMPSRSVGTDERLVAAGGAASWSAEGRMADGSLAAVAGRSAAGVGGGGDVGA